MSRFDLTPLEMGVAALQLIRDARDYYAEHGRYPLWPEGPDSYNEQCFDDWAADLSEMAVEPRTAAIWVEELQRLRVFRAPPHPMALQVISRAPSYRTARLPYRALAGYSAGVSTVLSGHQAVREDCTLRWLYYRAGAPQRPAGRPSLPRWAKQDD